MSSSMMMNTRWMLSAICFGGLLVASACADSPDPSSSRTLASSSPEPSCGTIMADVIAVKDACRDAEGVADYACAVAGGYEDLMTKFGACCELRPDDEACDGFTTEH